jgi:osmotically-inducible protein OsmY
MRQVYLSDTEAVIDDDRLQHLILDRIDGDPAFWVGRARKPMIAVEVEDGYATLSGFVRSAADRRRADILARALGALGVDNRIQVEADLKKPA